MTQNKWSLQMKIVIGIVSVAAVFAVIAGVIYGISAANREDVLVIPVSDADYGSEDDYSGTMSGQVTTGSSQSVLYDPDKSIVEIKVKKGDRVSKGAELVVYDATQTSDELEQKELDVRSIEVSLKKAQRTLDTLNAAQQVIVPEEVEEEDEDDEEEEDVIGTAEEAPSGTESAEASDSQKTEKTQKSAKGKTHKMQSVMETAQAPAETETKTTETVTDDANVTDASTTSETADTDDDDDADDDDDEDEDEDDDDGPDFSDFKPGDTVYMDSAGEVYSPADLRKAKIEAENDIRSLTTDLSEASANLEATQKALSSDTALATIDGVVAQVNDPADGNLEAGETVVLVSTFDGIFVNTALNEWALGTIDVGSRIYVTSWKNGKTYKAKVTEISPYASSELAQQYADDETNDSYYPMTAIIEKDNAKLSDGDTVEVSLTKPEDYEDDEEEDGSIYLYKAFVVSEGGNKFVYKADENGKLVKQQIEVSGQETETYIVTGGITEDDYIAFPFGDNIREGANTVEGEIDDLYEDY